MARKSRSQPPPPRTGPVAASPRREPPAALLQQAIFALQQGQVVRAEGLLQQVLQAEPENFDALHLLGLGHLKRKEHRAGLALLERAVAVQPGFAPLHNNMGVAWRELGDDGAALACYDRALALQPEHGQAHFNRGVVLEALQRADEALAAYGQAIHLRPTHEAGWLHRAALLDELGRADEALAHCEQAVRLFPESADAWSARGSALDSLGRLDEALASYGRALELDPDKAEVLANAAQVLARLRRHGEAAQAYDQLLARRPSHPYAPAGRLLAQLHAADWTAHPERVAEIERAVAAGEPAATPFDFLAISGDPALQRRCAEAFVAARHGAAPLPPEGPTPGGSERRIRLAYVSADFHDHATAHLMAGLFERHDRNRFEVWAVSTGPERPGPMRERLRAAFEHFVDVRTWSDRAVALAMREWGIDIAVDLKGHTQDSRPDIFVLRAAPVQVAWLGYPGTTGLPAIDYLLADATIVPPGAEPHYSERVVRLPGTYQVNDPARAVAATPLSRAEAGLPEQGFVFCCFNSTYKITPPVFAVWMRLLRAVAGSVLWLLEDTPAASANLRRAAAQQGVDPARLVFAGRLPLPDHLARHRLADLFLDTLPVNAHTTASDALWAGLPVLTCAGEAFAGRVAASLLHAIGLDDLVTRDLAAYEARALELARDPAALRGRVVPARLADVDPFRARLEAAFVEMFRLHGAGMAPLAFGVDAAGAVTR